MSIVNMVEWCAQFRATLYGHHSVWVIDAYRNSELNLEQHDSVLLCALQWNLSIVDTPGTTENV